jgi:hypothetical protein
MIHRYKLDKVAGPSGTFAGYVLLAVGILTVYFSLTALLLILLGAIMAFSYRGSEIDTTGKRYRSTLVLSGFYSVGEWVDFAGTDEFRIKKFKAKYTAFSRGNRQLDIPQSDFRVILLSENAKKEIHFAKYDSETEARKLAADLEELIPKRDQTNSNGTSTTPSDKQE